MVIGEGELPSNQQVYHAFKQLLNTAFYPNLLIIFINQNYLLIL